MYRLDTSAPIFTPVQARRGLDCLCEIPENMDAAFLTGRKPLQRRVGQIRDVLDCQMTDLEVKSVH